MTNFNFDIEQGWANAVAASYSQQVEEGVDEPRLPEHHLWDAPGGRDREILKDGHGLVTAAYPDGVRLEPVSEYPRRGEMALIQPRGAQE